MTKNMSNNAEVFAKLMARMQAVDAMVLQDTTPVESTNHRRVSIPEASLSLNLTPSKPFNLSVEDPKTVEETNQRIDGAAIDLSGKLAYAIDQVARIEKSTQAREMQLTCRILELEQTNSELEQTNSGLKMRNSELVAIHVGLNLHMSNSEIFRSELESRNLELVESISELESRNLELMESNSELGVYTTDLNTRMTNLHACVTARETELAGQTGSMEELVRIHNAQIHEFSSRIDAITHDKEDAVTRATEVSDINKEMRVLLHQAYEEIAMKTTENETMTHCLEDANLQLQFQHGEMPVDEQESSNTHDMHMSMARRTREMAGEHDALKGRIETMKNAMDTMLAACGLADCHV